MEAAQTQPFFLPVAEWSYRASFLPVILSVPEFIQEVEVSQDLSLLFLASSLEILRLPALAGTLSMTGSGLERDYPNQYDRKEMRVWPPVWTTGGVHVGQMTNGDTASEQEPIYYGRLWLPKKLLPE